MGIVRARGPGSAQVGRIFITVSRWMLEEFPFRNSVNNKSSLSTDVQATPSDEISENFIIWKLEALNFSPSQPHGPRSDSQIQQSLSLLSRLLLLRRARNKKRTSRLKLRQTSLLIVEHYKRRYWSWKSDLWVWVANLFCFSACQLGFMFDGGGESRRSWGKGGIQMYSKDSFMRYRAAKRKTKS